MRLYVSAIVVLLLDGAGGLLQPPADTKSPPPGVRLEALAWPEAADRLRPDTVIVLPLASGAVQHGPHLELGTEARLTAYLVERLLAVSDIVVAPPVTYHHYPAFDDYPGTASLPAETARDLTLNVVRSFVRQGPRRFYVLNAASTATETLDAAARQLASEGVLLRFTDFRALLAQSGVKVGQPAGLHADELVTSMMLHVAPSTVQMSRAVRAVGPPSSPFRLTPRPGAPGTYSPSGIWGDATLATAEKGRLLTESLVASLQAEIESVRRSALPAGAPRAAVPAAPRRPRSGAGPDRFMRGADECLAADESAIRMIGPAFVKAWRELDADKLAVLWMPLGDMIHPDGSAESSAAIIRANRAYLFARREYRDSRHSLDIGQVRCITPDVAVAEAKWELRGVVDGGGTLLPPAEGLGTLVLRKEGGWRIEAYRYTITPSKTSAPAVLPRPGPTGQPGSR